MTYEVGWFSKANRVILAQTEEDCTLDDLQRVVEEVVWLASNVDGRVDAIFEMSDNSESSLSALLSGLELTVRPIENIVVVGIEEQGLASFYGGANSSLFAANTVEEAHSILLQKTSRAIVY